MKTKINWNAVVFYVLVIFQCCTCIEYRLPRALSPQLYDIKIITHLDDHVTPFSFYGEARILIKCLEPTTNITLHSKDLKINKHKTEVTDLDTMKTVPVSSQTFVNENDFFIILLEKKLVVDQQYEIHLEFEGKLVDGLAGYYRSSYIDNKTQKKHWLAVTQFEATYARRAFPCFDEPNFKAKFLISLGHNKNLTALSNMPLNFTETMEKKGWVLDVFDESVPMSTYLVAFVVSDLKYKASPHHKNTDVVFKIWAREDALDQVDFAREVGPRALSFFEQYFNIKYPLPKQDMIAIPDFGAGAMENWGLITYREVYLLHDSVVSSIASKHRVASVIAHELAHQWFGNLVTMKWWTDLWLNEGFATYMAGVAVHHLYPKWNSLNEEVVNNLLQVYSLDSLKSSHPISVHIENPDKISEIFDTISYKKGSYLIRMMSLFLGEQVLRKGVSNYLKERVYMNAAQDDLWKSLTEEAHHDKSLSKKVTVKMIMDTWTLQTGYPVVQVMRDYENGKVSFEQERFLRERTVEYLKKETCWWVPISYTTEDDVNFNSTIPKLWLSCPETPQSVELSDADSWIIVNIQAAGLYKVNYDDKNWNMIIDTLKSEDYKTIPTINRVLLIDNALDLAKADYLNYEIPFDLLSYMKNEDEYLPWKTALAKMGYVSTMFKRTPSYGIFKKYMKKLILPIYDSLGGIAIRKEKHDHLDAVNFQVLIAQAACKYSVVACSQDAVVQFQYWQNNPVAPNPISQDIRSVVYCAAIKEGGEEEWNFLWEQYKKSNVGSEKTIILQALGCSREIWLLNRYLEWSIGADSGVRKQDALTVFGSVAHNDIGYFVARAFFESNINLIHKSVLPVAQRLSSYISTLASQMITGHEYKEFKKFTNEYEHYFNKSKIGVQQALETISINVQWHAKYYDEVKNILMKTSNLAA